MRITMMIGAMLCLSAITFSQQEVSIPATKDNTLYENVDGATSNGAGIYLFTGNTNAGSARRAVVMFDLTGKVPSDATILDVKVKLNMSKSVSGAANVALHTLISSWGEGTSDAGANEGSGASSTTNDATWIHRFFDTQNWTTAGGDFSSIPSASLSISGTGSYQFGSTTELVTDVQNWLSNPSSNHGWIIIGNESANQTTKRFDSRETGTAANRPTLIVQYSIVNSVAEFQGQPREFVLHQNFPNPFNPSTVIRYSVPASGNVSLKIFDLLGNEIASLVNGVKNAGTFAQEWNASGVPSGLYFYRLQTENFVATKKMLLVK